MAYFEKRRRAYHSELQHEKDTKPESYAENRAYHKFMKEMIPLETKGSAQDRFQSAAQKWKSQRTSVDEAMERAANNKSVM